MLKEDFTKNWNNLKFSTEIEKYDQSGNKNVYIDDSEQKKMKKSKSDPEMLKQNLTPTDNADSANIKDKLENAQEIMTPADDGCNFGKISF